MNPYDQFYTNDNSAVVSQTMTSVYQILSDADIMNALQSNGWDFKPSIATGADILIYNRSRNAALKLTQGGSIFVILSVISLAHPQHDALVGPYQVSAFDRAKEFVLGSIQQFADYDPFENMNSVNSMNFS